MFTILPILWYVHSIILFFDFEKNYIQMFCFKISGASLQFVKVDANTDMESIRHQASMSSKNGKQCHCLKI